MKTNILMAVLLVAAIALIAGCTGQSNSTTSANNTSIVSAGDNVTLDYTLWVDNNTTIYDTSNATLAQEAGIYDPMNYSYTPISFVVGGNQVLPDF